MHLIYIDDSHEGNFNIFSAIAIPDDQWSDVFKAIRGWRQKIKDSDDIYVYKELHAWKFVSGRGRIAPSIVTKWRRSQLFKEALRFLSKQQHIRIFNSCSSNPVYAFERLLNRINRTMKTWASRAIIICDEGKEDEYIRLVRKMSVHNPIPSQFGAWLDTGKATKNIPIDRIIEDPFFRSSSKSYFIQMADFCAYALLRREKRLAAKDKYLLHEAFDVLKPVCVKAASPKDPFGIIRDK